MVAKKPKRILLVEDNEEIQQLIAHHLPRHSERYHFTVVSDGGEGLKHSLSSDYDLLLLDIMLPVLGGIEICREARKAFPERPIIIITARSGEMDKVIGLEVGADDYLVKPFAVEELFLRIDALFRRQLYNQRSGRSDLGEIRLGALRIDLAGRKAYVHESLIELTPTEFDILHVMAASPGKAFSRFDLLKLLWGDGDTQSEDMVSAHMNRLRRKLSDDREAFIETVWGVGYRFNCEH